MDCLKCHCYVYDTIHMPFSGNGVRHQRALAQSHLLVPEFIRLARGDGNADYLAVLFAEAGGVHQICKYQNPLRAAYAWIRHQMNLIGDIGEIHRAHTPGLRIRIPVERLNANAPEWTPTPTILRIRIPSIRA
jgi:hypothetical protein